MAMQMRKTIAKNIYRSLSDAYEADGRFGFELEIHPFESDKYLADMVIHLIDPNLKHEDDLLIGIELKDWSDSIYKALVIEEYEGYKDQFDMFYMAARRFGYSTHNKLDHNCIGLLDSEEPDNIHKRPRPRSPNERARSACIEELNQQWGEERDFNELLFPEFVETIE